MSKVDAISGGRLVDLHQQLDDAISRGATAGVLIVTWPEEHEGNEWEAHGSQGLTRAERAFIYQQLILIEIADQEVD